MVFLTLLVCLAYGNCLKGDFVSDDIPSILKNEELGDVNYFFRQPSSFLRPLFYFIINKIFGRTPIFYRLLNIYFHLGTVLIVYILLSILIGSKTAFFTCSILAVHPIQAEAVSWISGGTYPQYSFFLIFALLTYILSKKNKKLFLVSIFSFILSLASCPNAMVLPLILLVFIISFGNIRKNWRDLIPFFILSLIWGLIYLGKIGQRITDLQIVHYQKPQILNPFIQIPIAITSYLELIFWPKDLTLYHSEMTFSQAQYIFRLIIFIIFLGIIVYGFIRDRRFFFWPSFFLISLLPTLTPLGISWIVAERYVYLGTVGIFIIVALGIKKLSETKNLKIATWILFSLVIIGLLSRTITRNIDWKNEDNLWIATAKTSPSSPNAHNNLGDVYSRQGNLETAAAEFQMAIRIKPNYADAYHNLAYTYQQMDRSQDAVRNYKKAVEFNPNLWQSYQNLAGIYFNEKKFSLARDNLEIAVRLNPASSKLNSNLGLAYLFTGERVRAEEAFQKSLQLDSNDERAIEGLRILGLN